MPPLLEPFLRYEFMRNSLAAVVLIGIICAPIGVYVVLRGMAFVGDAMSHTILPGVVLAFLNGWSLFVGALVAAIITAFSIGWLSRRQAVKEDTAIGIVFSGMFALGILLMSTTNSFRDFTHVLFGYILGVSADDLKAIAVLAAIVLAVLAALHKELELTSFDPIQAQVMGLQPARMRYILLILLALAIVTAIQAVGVVLTSAMLVTPAATATLLTKRLSLMMILATLIAVGSGVVGLYFSYTSNVSSGAAIVLTCTIVFGLVWAGRGLLRIGQRRLAANPMGQP
jgi:ABC-type Mn2+/Zn2+ transport system permease subunit